MKTAVVVVALVAVVGAGAAIALTMPRKAKPSSTPGTTAQAIGAAQDALVKAGFVGASDADVAQIVSHLADGSGWRYHGSVYG
jgi:lysozyme family protein